MESDGVMDKNIRYERSDSERSSSGSSIQSSEDEEDITPISGPRLPVETMNQQSRGTASSRAADEEELRNRQGLLEKRSNQSEGRGTGNASASEGMVESWIEKMRAQKGRVLQVSRDRPPKRNADSIPYKLTVLWMSGLTPPEVSQTSP